MRWNLKEADGKARAVTHSKWIRQCILGNLAFDRITRVRLEVMHCISNMALRRFCVIGGNPHDDSKEELTLGGLVDCRDKRLRYQ